MINDSYCYTLTKTCNDYETYLLRLHFIHLCRVIFAITFALIWSNTSNKMPLMPMIYLEYFDFNKSSPPHVFQQVSVNISIGDERKHWQFEWLRRKMACSSVVGVQADNSTEELLTVVIFFRLFLDWMSKIVWQEKWREILIFQRIWFPIIVAHKFIIYKQLH